MSEAINREIDKEETSKLDSPNKNTDIWAEMKEDLDKQLRKLRKPIINEVKKNLAAPRGTEEMFRESLKSHKNDIILLLTKFIRGKRKQSTQNRLNNMKTEKLISFAKEVGFIV